MFYAPEILSTDFGCLPTKFVSNVIRAAAIAFVKQKTIERCLDLGGWTWTSCCRGRRQSVFLAGFSEQCSVQRQDFLLYTRFRPHDDCLYFNFVSYRVVLLRISDDKNKENNQMMTHSWYQVVSTVSCISSYSDPILAIFQAAQIQIFIAMLRLSCRVAG